MGKVGLRLEHCLNQLCPCSGKPVRADSLTVFNGAVVGFCNPDCRDTFDRAIGIFNHALTAFAPR